MKFTFLRFIKRSLYTQPRMSFNLRFQLSDMAPSLNRHLDKGMRSIISQDRLSLTYITPQGPITVKANAGDNLLDIAHANNVDLEGVSF